MKITVASGLVVAFFLSGFTLGWAAQRDETTLTVQVGSADHELVDGYFSLGDTTTVMAKPGTQVYRFLSRQRGRTVTVTLTESTGPELSRLVR